MWYVWLLVGVVIGTCLTSAIHHSKKTNGVLKVREDEGESYLFLELSQQDLDDIHNKDYVILKVDITHK